MTGPTNPPLFCLCAEPIAAANFPQLDPKQVNGGDTKAQMARSGCENQLPHAHKDHQNCGSMHRTTQQ
jgi:hypothetical protein